MSLLEGVTTERARELLGELSLNQLMGLVFVKAGMDKQRVTIRVRPAEARVRVVKAKVVVDGA